MLPAVPSARPAVPSREPELLVSDKASDAGELGLQSTLPVAGRDVDTPTMSPAGDAGDVSADDASTEEPTVEEVSLFEETVAEAVILEDVEISNDDSDGDVSDTETDLASTRMTRMNRITRKIKNTSRKFRLWFIFWAVAIASGVLAFYANSQYDIYTARPGFSGLIHLYLVPREKWDDTKYVVSTSPSYMANRVVVTHTEMLDCNAPEECTELLKANKPHIMNFNFLLATDGCIYEALGWQEPSPLFKESRTMAVAFIGNYETTSPTAIQLEQLQALLEASQELNYLSDPYSLTGRKLNVVPCKLFAHLSTFDYWDKENSDTDDLYVDGELDPFPMFEF